MGIHKFDCGNVVIVAFDMPNELLDPAELGECVQEEIERGRLNFLVDLQNVTYISSSVLGFFINTIVDLRKKGGTMKVFNVQPYVANIFEMTRVGRVIEIFNDQHTALQSF